MSSPPKDVSITNECGDVCVITWTPLNSGEIESKLHSPTIGAVLTFVGYTRNSFQGKTVTRLEYESYTPLAIKTLRAITLEARNLPSLEPSINSYYHPPTPSLPTTGTTTSTDAKSFPSIETQTPSITTPPISSKIIIEKIVIYHLLGSCPVGQASLVISVSSSHRKEAFRVCEFILERVKQSVEIWKREFYAEAEGELAEEGLWKVNSEVDQAREKERLEGSLMNTS